MSDKEIFEKVYEKPGAVWTRTEPPPEIISLVENGAVKPCKAIDIGCGEGIYSIYLASKGFDVTGIDFSESAIKYAQENAANKGVKVDFIVMDACDLGQLKDKFDFALEWTLLHHIMPPQREKYVESIKNILNEKGKYLSVCFNEKSPEFGNPGEKYRESPIGTKLYYSSQDELRELFKPHFRVLEAKLMTLVGREKDNKHIGNYFLVERAQVTEN